MSLITFIDTNYLLAISPIELNVDSATLIPTILYAQEMNILPLLGTGIYNELKTQIDGSTLTNANEILLTAYTKMALANWTLYEALPFLHFKITNKGIDKKTGENAEPVALNELNYLRDKVKNQAEFYSERVTKFLQANTITYPLYLSPGSGVDTILPNQTNYTQGLYIPGSSRNCDWGKDRS